MELLSGHEKIITKSGISLNVGTLNRGFTVPQIIIFILYPSPSKIILTRTRKQSIQILAEVLNTKFHNNPSRGNYIVLLDRWTDITKLEQLFGLQPGKKTVM
jgi:hypothetical protein